MSKYKYLRKYKDGYINKEQSSNEEFNGRSFNDLMLKCSAIVAIAIFLYSMGLLCHTIYKVVTGGL